ncbi:MAG: hypothetical protein AAGF89_11090 [Bacteroidota bacterium]
MLPLKHSQAINDILGGWAARTQLFHYAGHAVAGGLDLSGQVALTDQLLDFFRKERSAPQLVFLNGCSTVGHVDAWLAAGKEHPLPGGSNHHQLAYRRGINSAPEIELVIRLTNRLERPLHVSLLTMEVDFYCGTDLLGPPVVLLENQALAIYPESGQPDHLRVSPADYLLTDGWPHDTIWFKVLVSTHAAPLETAVADYALAGLPHPRSMGASIIQPDNRRRKAPTAGLRGRFKLI